MTAPDGYRYKQAYHDLSVAMEYLITDLSSGSSASVHARAVKLAEDALRRTQFFITEGEQMALYTSSDVRERTREMLRGLT